MQPPAGEGLTPAESQTGNSTLEMFFCFFMSEEDDDDGDGDVAAWVTQEFTAAS